MGVGAHAPSRITLKSGGGDESAISILSSRRPFDSDSKKGWAAAGIFAKPIDLADSRYKTFSEPNYRDFWGDVLMRFLR